MTSNSNTNGAHGSPTPLSHMTAWDPVTLLNPRISSTALPAPQPHIPLAGQGGPLASGPGSPASLDFQFSSPSPVPSPIYHGGLPYHGLRLPRPPQRRDTAPVYSQTNGAGNFVERMSNVLDRSDVPKPKRRKTENEKDLPFAAGGLHGAGFGSLAHHIKESQDEGKLAPVTRGVETVDLTDGDESLKNGDRLRDPDKDEEVCLGMIEGTTISCHRVPSPKPGMMSIGGDAYWPQVKVVLRRKAGEPTSKIHVYDFTRQVFGLVDAKTANGLAPLLDSPLQIRTDCRIPPRRRLPDERPGELISRQYKFQLMIYSPRKYARQIGRHLASRMLTLVSPPRVDAGIKVFNPHSKDSRPPPAPRYSSASMEGISYSQPAPVTRTAEEVRSEVMGVFDSLTRSEDLPELEPHAIVQTPLLRHQKQALYFMMTRESGNTPSARDNPGIINSSWQRKVAGNGQAFYYNVITGESQREPPSPTRGGILADMMGLGKTLSILSLAASTLADAAEWERLPPLQPAPPEKKQLHHAKQFGMPRTQGLGLTPLSQNGRGTLLICPLSTIVNWEEQIKQHIEPESIKYHVYHGQNRIKDVALLSKFDLVITTYGSVSSELTGRHRGKNGPFPLEEIGWFRIVLDEAHMIREQNTLQFKAACRLQASRRWAVTGTPVQNRLDDLAALLAFLRLKPFDDKTKFLQYIVVPFKNADTEIVPKLRVLVDTITLRRLKDKIDLPPRSDQVVRLNFSAEEQRVYDLFAKNAQDRVQVLTTQSQDKVLGGKTYIHILQSILRLRLICAHGKELLNDEDLRLLQGMTADAPIDLDSDDDDDKPALPEAKAYELLDLMQNTNNDNCVKCSRKLGANDTSDIESERQEDILGYMTPCFHIYCPPCVGSFRDTVTGVTHDSNAYGNCPICSSYVRFSCAELRRTRADAEHESHAHPKGVEKRGVARLVSGEGYGGPHTKTRALIEDLLASKAESETNPDEPPFKTVVFSGWTSHLDLIQYHLDRAGITHTRLDGKMSRPARIAAMDTFRDDPTVQVILVSIMAGGLGLNLTAANSVYIMEPQFNPAAEAQAIDRVHRLGQRRPVKAVRYIMRDSFEERMLELQEKKKKLASLSMDRRDKEKVSDRTEAAKQRLMDLRSLFK